jgi:hypothetical protein
MQNLANAAVQWAEKNGFVPPLDKGEVEKVEFPQSGFGFRVWIKETKGRQRLGTAFFKHDGSQDMWTVDGIVV